MASQTPFCSFYLIFTFLHYFQVFRSYRSDLSLSIPKKSDQSEETATEEVVEDTTSNIEEVAEDEHSESESESESEEPLPSVEELLKEREQLKAKVEEWKGLYYKINDAFQKKSTEVQDTRKRLERMNEVNQAKLRGQVVSNIFSPFENLKRSIDACTKAGVDEGLTNGTEYFYVVTAVYDEGESGYSNEASATPAEFDPIPPVNLTFGFISLPLTPVPNVATPNFGFSVNTLFINDLS